MSNKKIISEKKMDTMMFMGSNRFESSSLATCRSILRLVRATLEEYEDDEEILGLINIVNACYMCLFNGDMQKARFYVEEAQHYVKQYMIDIEVQHKNDVCYGLAMVRQFLYEMLTQ